MDKIRQELNIATAPMALQFKMCEIWEISFFLSCVLHTFWVWAFQINHLHPLVQYTVLLQCRTVEYTIHIYCTASVISGRVQTAVNLINVICGNDNCVVSCLPPRQDQTMARAWTQSVVWLRFSKLRRRRSQSMCCFLKGACPDAGSSSCR